MKSILIFSAIFFSFRCSAQKIIDAVMTNEKGVTENARKAKYLIVLKQYGDTAFERLYYNFAGPIKSRSTFSDKELTVLHGKYAEYRSSGYLSSDGQYFKNMKDGRWLAYDDTTHAILEYKYHLDTLLSVIDLDSLSAERKKIPEDTTGQIEAYYKGGGSMISKIIGSNFQVTDRMSALKKGGTVSVRFIINTSGNPFNIELARSVEFSFDEESMRVISLLKDWMPANDKGRLVNAYRIQPIVVNF